jgi:hypothetical protein
LGLDGDDWLGLDRGFDRVGDLALDCWWQGFDGWRQRLDGWWQRLDGWR